ncbi:MULTISPECIES: hypothetical protein [unclassified Afipia]|nr:MULTISPECIES: hypothetical protein [unclassified Afipia]
MADGGLHEFLSAAFLPRRQSAASTIDLIETDVLVPEMSFGLQY